MRRLLRSMGEGVPTDTLMARVKGRSSFLVQDWEPLLFSPAPLQALPAAPWRQELSPGSGYARVERALRRERERLFGWMNEPLRCLLAPLFWLEEIHLLASTIRRVAGQMGSESDALRESLLAADLKRTLATGSVVKVLEELAARLSVIDPEFAALPGIYTGSGTAGVEAALNDITLEHCVRVSRNSQLTRYFRLLMDSRNLLTIAKHLRWRLPAPTKYLKGGSLRHRTLQELGSGNDMPGLMAQVARLGGAAAAAPDSTPEKGLLGARLLFLKHLAREEEGAGVLLDYLCRCSMEARNIALLAGMTRAGGDAVAAEIAG